MTWRHVAVHVHPVENIRGTASRHLAGRTIVLGVCGSIAAVKSVELARELIRHGAHVVPVMTSSAARIIHPDALHFACGQAPITQLSGAVEHVALLGDVKGRADLLLVAPATANSIAKMALGIDDSPVTTCATVAFGTKVPVVVAPAMHEAMLNHPLVGDHQKTLVERLGVTWVEPLHEEKKAKLADVEAIVEAVIHRLANDRRRPGPLAGQRALVISGATAEPIDPVRILTNRSSGQTGILLAQELHRLGAEVALWQGYATVDVPAHLVPCAVRFSTHADLMDLVRATDIATFDQVWMPAAIGDYGAVPAKAKIPSDSESLTLELGPLPKVIEAVRAKAPKTLLVAFKAESETRQLLARAKQRLKRYKADYVVANGAESFGAAHTEATLLGPGRPTQHGGTKADVMAAIVAQVAANAAATRRKSKVAGVKRTAAKQTSAAKPGKDDKRRDAK